MSKIKQINISDFRVYEGTQKFKFENERGIANLIALYAPNGYGKTSFFDAIEWGYSDIIKRIANDDEIKRLDYNNKIKDKVILTNRISFKKNPNTIGKVEIFTEKGRLRKEVQFYTRRNTNGTRNDYKEGKLSGDFKKNQIQQLVNTNILSQDQIDSFLRYTTPEQKFELLKEFWPQGEFTLEKYKIVDNTLKQIEKDFNENRGDIKRLNEELKQIVFDPKKIQVINSTIDKLEKNKVLNIKYIKLEQGISQNIYEKLYKEISNAQSILDKNEKIENEKTNILNQLIVEFDSFNNQKKDLENIMIEIKLIIEKRGLFQNLKLNQEHKQDLVKKQDIFKHKIIEYYRIANGRKMYVAHIELINQLKKAVIVNEELSKSFNQEILDIEKWIIKLERSRNECIQTRNLEEVNCSKLDDRIKLLINYNQEEKILSEKQIISKKEIDDIRNLINTERESLREYKLCVEKKDWFNNDFIEQSESYKQNTSHLKELLSKIEIKNSEIEDKTNYLNKSGSLNENINRIKLWGKEYVEQTKVKFCPLCASKFETFDDLLSTILADKEDVLQIEILTKKLETNKNELFILTVESKEIEIIINKYINDKIQQIEKKQGENLKKQDELLSIFNGIDNKLKYLIVEISSIKKYLVDYLKEGETLTEIILPEIKNRVQKNIDDLKFKTCRIEKILKWKESLKDSRQYKKNESSKIVQNSFSDIKIIETNSTFKDLTELIEKLNLDVDNLKEEKYIKDILKEIENKEIENKENIIIVEAKIEENNFKIKKSDCNLEFDNIIGTISEKENTKETLIKSIECYNEKYTRCIKDPKYSKNELDSEKFKSFNCLDQLEEYQQLLNSCKSDLELIKEGVKKSELATYVEKLSNKNKDLENLKNKIIRVQNLFIDYIQKGITNYFNKEVINQIYKRIEPHPKLKEIDFKAEIGEKGPRLVITTRSIDDEVNPTLFLSAGQVNILSLSIFLAKAFEYGNDTISTIFMDDPIQNLSDINILSFIDILRTLTNEQDKQIVISTHDEKFFRLLQNKLPEKYCNSKYIEFESEGKLKIN